jgi:colicin import membrane protein
LPQLQNNDKFPQSKRQGILWSSILHILLFILLVSITFKVNSPMPVPVEEGLLVNFGFDETGDGLFEPAPAPTQAPAAQTPAAVVEKSDDDAIITQDFEEAPEVKKAEPTPEEIQRKADAIAAENKRKAEAEAERIRIQQETAERIRKEEEQKKLNAISNRTKNAFGNAGNTGTSGTSEGIAGGTGNQGVESGTPGVRNYGPGGGTGTTGVSYSIAGRKNQALPLPVYDYQGEGIVVVEVTVNKAGSVIKAVPGVKGSTTLDEYLLRVAKEAALKAKFDDNINAPEIQKGTITYIFKLK